jgi:predicted dehydrogenase
VPARGPRRLRVGVLGCGVIAQVMHLPHLCQLEDRFEIAALCDLSTELLTRLGSRYGVERLHTSYEEMLDDPLDAVLVLSPGSHAPPACAAAEAGLHVFVEKPMCIAVREGEEMIAAADRSGVTLMVGYHKRFDPAYQAAARLVTELDDIVLVRTSTLESPQEPYLEHHRLLPATGVDPAVLAELQAADDAVLAEALPGVSDPVRRFYRTALIDSMIHDVNMLAGLCGRPRLRHSTIRPAGDGVVATFELPSGADAVSTWTATPGIVRYEQDVWLCAPDQRITLRFPSPFLRNAPTGLIVEAGDGESSWRQDQITSYDEAFRRELEAFHHYIVTGEPPLTNGREGLADVALLQEIARAADR